MKRCLIGVAAATVLLLTGCPSPQTLPPVPTGLTVGDADCTSLCISWSTAAGADSYQLYRDVDQGGAFAALVYSNQDSQFQDMGLEINTAYWYKVRATNAAGSSALSEAVSGSTTALAVPAAVAISAATDTSLSLTWNAVTGADTYQVMKDAAPNGSFATEVYAGSALQCTDTGLALGTDYYYEVRALRGSAVSAYSAPVQGTTTGMRVPTGLTVGVPGTGSLQVSWQAVSNATGYRVVRDTSLGGAYSTVVFDASATSFTDSGLAYNATYYYEVQSYNASLTSDLSSAVPGTTKVLYTVYSPCDSALAGFAINGLTGALSDLPGSRYTTGTYPASAAVTADGRFVYVTNSGSNSVTAYRAGSDGALTVVGSYATGTNPHGVAVDPAGAHAYVANYGDGTLSCYAIDSGTGALTPFSTGNPYTVGAFVTAITIHPTGKFAYVVFNGTSAIKACSIATGTGALGSIGNATTGGYPSRVAIDPAGKFAYTANRSDNTVSGFAINAGTGALTALTPATTATGSSPGATCVDPLSRFVFVTNGGDNTVSRYSFDSSTGALTSLGTATPTGLEPDCAAEDPGGAFLYVPNYSNGGISAYTIGGSGSLTIVPGSQFTVGSGPVMLVTATVP
jgi:6-phosphogluconolactonase (cycloisomerase 2 family)/fibronectin type 3 domain-containing protein